MTPELRCVYKQYHVKRNMAKRRPSISEINSMNNAQLKSTLKEMVKSLEEAEKSDDSSGENPNPTEEILKQILEEVKKMNVYRVQTDQQIHELKESNDLLKKTLAQQQRFLEGLDADKRAQNIIALGVPENELSVGDHKAENDDEKWMLIKNAIGCPESGHVRINRLGRPNGNTCRPLKIVLTHEHDRPLILEKASNLQSADPAFSNIRLKKDTHPAIRREYGRLHEVEKKEREKPENAGRAVTYDHKLRAVLVDGKIVDSFMPTFF